MRTENEGCLRASFTASCTPTMPEFHRELYPDHAGNISFADDNPFNLRRANLVLHKTVVARLENPYGPEELATLYQDHSLEWLCSEAPARLSRVGSINKKSSVNEEAVRRWLAECNITPRTAGEEQARLYALDRDRRREWLEKGARVHAENVRAGITVNRVDHLHTLEMKQRAKEAYLKTLLPCECPWSDDLLGRYYHRHGWSLKTLAAKAARQMGPSQRPPRARDVKRWLLVLGVSVRTSPQQRAREARLRQHRKKTAVAPRNQPCPLSTERLRELYWREGRTWQQMQGLCVEILGQPVSAVKMKRWLLEAGLTLRSRSEATRLRHRQNPQLVQSNVAAMRKANAARSPGPGPGAYMSEAKRKAVQRKAAKASAKASKERASQTRTCALPGCAHTITRPAGQFTSEYAYCCASHRAEDVMRRRKEDQEQERWEKRLGIARPVKPL